MKKNKSNVGCRKMKKIILMLELEKWNKIKVMLEAEKWKKIKVMLWHKSEEK